MDPRAQTPMMDPRAQTLAMDQSTNPIDGSEHKPSRWIRAHTSRWIPEPKPLWWTPKRKIKHFFSLVLLVAILNLESFFVNTFLFNFLNAGYSCHLTVLHCITLGSLLKYWVREWSWGLKNTLYLYIPSAWKQCPSIYSQYENNTHSCIVQNENNTHSCIVQFLVTR